MIRHAAFKHGWFYHYRVHLEKLSRLSAPFPELERFLVAMFEDCPHEYFSGGPRSSKLQIPLALDPVHVPGHEICSFTAFALANGRYKTAHSNVQVSMLENDNRTVACEVPLWIEHGELDGYRELFDSEKPLTGHIDALSIEGDAIWVWDYKPSAAKEKHAHLQTYLYAVMLSKRTGIALERFRCGYFDDCDCYLFRPESPELLLPLAAR